MIFCDDLLHSSTHDAFLAVSAVSPLAFPELCPAPGAVDSTNVLNRMMKSGRMWCGVVAIASIGFAAVPARAGAQASAASELETRASLEAKMRKAEAAHRTSEAWLLKTRLEKGDFQDGDKIIVNLLGTRALAGTRPGDDTITVRAGKMMPLPLMASLPLEGVLRSELTARLSAHLGKYLKDSSVRATPLVRIAVLGQVRAPGYYYVTSDVLLNDVVMRAGGPLQTADVGNMIIRRSGDVIWDSQDTRTALSDGLSLERLNLRAGDELFVDDMKRGSIPWALILQLTGSALTLYFGIRRVSS